MQQTENVARSRENGEGGNVSIKKSDDFAVSSMSSLSSKDNDCEHRVSENDSDLSSDSKRPKEIKMNVKEKSHKPR